MRGRFGVKTAAGAACLCLCGASLVWAQEKDIASVADMMEARVAASLERYQSLQSEIAEEKVPLLQEINALENRAITLSARIGRMRTVEEGERERLVSAREEARELRTQNDYVAGLLTQYLNTFEGRLHVAEDQRFEARLSELSDAIDRVGSGSVEARDLRAEAVERCLDRLDLVSGGYRFSGKAIDATGEILSGDILVYGPAAYFRDTSGGAVGLLNFRPGAIEPALTRIEGEMGAVLRAYGSHGEYVLPLDASLGKAITLEEASGTWQEHVQKGGAVGYAIIAMGGLALLLTLVKLVDFKLLSVSLPSNLAAIAAAACKGEKTEVDAQVKGCAPWMRAMLNEGAAHARGGRELMEDHMISVILHRKPQLERFLPWLSVTAAATPLMGLLGTVVGMIKTFTLITIFGSGDPKALSSGISEALVTTELGLIVAIPTLIIHGALLRLAKRRISSMELAATEFSKVVSKLSGKRED